MKNVLSAILIICLALPVLCFNANAQTGDSLIFAYASKADGAANLADLTFDENSDQDYRYYVIKKVMDDLIEAKGDRSKLKPRLYISDTESWAAFMNSRKIEIGVEKKAYDICAAMGKDSLAALAALIAHEITHYYENHSWSSQFVRENVGMATTSTLWKNRNREMLRTETEADYLGGFLGFRAGYNTLGVMDKMIPNLYRGYNFPVPMKNYPTEEERKEFAKNAMDKLEQLYHVFEMGNYMVAIGQYDLARRYYKKVVNEFQSREMFNNIGVISFLEALQLFDDDEVTYAYPIELDAESRLNSSTRDVAGFAKKKEKREALLSDAIDNFQQATLMDENYAIGFLNMACAFTLLGKQREAKFHLGTAMELAQNASLSKLEGDAFALKGIIADLNEDEDKVEENFKKGVELGSRVAKANLQIFNTGSPEPGQSVKGRISMGKVEKIGDKTPKLLAIEYAGSELDEENLETISIEVKKEEDEEQMDLIVYKQPDSRLYIHVIDESKIRCAVLFTLDNYEGKTLFDISLKSDTDLVEDKNHYGNASNTHLEFAKGQFINYPKSKILFKSKENKVEQWALYWIAKQSE